MKRSNEHNDPAAVLAWLERTGTRAVREGMARFAIPSGTAYGVTVGALRKEAKRLGRDHALAQALWESGRYEARMLATMVDDPAQVGAAQMDRWCRDFDNWAIVDTACFSLFDRTPHAWAKVAQWSAKPGEFQRRAGFALLWAMALHDRGSSDAPYAKALKLIGAAATDKRNFVRKAVDMALRAVARRSPALQAKAAEVAKRVAAARKVRGVGNRE